MSGKQLPALVMLISGGWGCVSSTLKILLPLLNKAVIMVTGIVAQTDLEVPRDQCAILECCSEHPSWHPLECLAVTSPWG